MNTPTRKQILKEMKHPKSERVLNTQMALKVGGCPAEVLEEATIECLTGIPSASTRQMNWENNDIQFPRLIAELEAAGVFARPSVMAELCWSMDLTEKEVLEIVERASNRFNEIKGAL